MYKIAKRNKASAIDKSAIEETLLFGTILHIARFLLRGNCIKDKD